MKSTLLSAIITLTAISSFAQSPCSDLFFSEYIEGTGQNKAIEIYNPTPNSIDLSSYWIYRFVNGSSTQGDTLYPTGILAPGATYNIVDPDSATDPTLVALADTLHTVTFFNGDDALGLYSGSLGLIDVIGEIGVDPGTNWIVGIGATSEYTLVRKLNVLEGTPNWAIGATQWDVYVQNDFSYFGSHSTASCSGASLNNPIEWDVVISPNPTPGTLYINSSIDHYSIQVLEISGKTVIQSINLSQNVELDLSGLANGTYFIKLVHEGNSLTKKILVAK